MMAAKGRKRARLFKEPSPAQKLAYVMAWLGTFKDCPLQDGCIISCDRHCQQEEWQDKHEPFAIRANCWEAFFAQRWQADMRAMEKGAYAHA